MYEIIIGNTSYPLNFGMGFIKEMNKRESIPVDGMPGVKQAVGLQWALAKVTDGDLEALQDVIFCANKNCNPRLNYNTLDEFFEDESTDIEGVKENILNFCRSANCTKQTMVKVDELFAQYLKMQETQE